MFGPGGVGGVQGEWVTRLGLGFTNSRETWRKCSLCFGCGGVGGEWVMWCYVCVCCEWIICVDCRSRYLYIVLCGFLRILGAPSVQSCCTLSISSS